MNVTVNYKINSFAATDIGRKREHNEDAFLRDDVLGLFVVADGMGGYAAGEIASFEAVEAVYGMIKSNKHILDKFIENPDKDTAHNLQRLIESAVQAATYLIFGMAEVDPDRHGMGTTISTLLLCANHGVIGQVGDSRIYKIRDEYAFQLTEDHTLVNWQIKTGLITPEQAKISPHKNVITRAVGSKDYVEVDTQIFPIEKGDKFLLCSDGLHGYIENDDEIVILFRNGIEKGARSFLKLANNRGGKDNITCILLELK